MGSAAFLARRNRDLCPMVSRYSKMTRVGFVLGQSSVGWLGGANYYRNLLSALDLLEGKPLELVVFTSPYDVDYARRNYGTSECIPVKYFQPGTLKNLAWRIAG